MKPGNDERWTTGTGHGTILLQRPRVDLETVCQQMRNSMRLQPLLVLLRLRGQLRVDECCDSRLQVDAGRRVGLPPA